MNTLSKKRLLILLPLIIVIAAAVVNIPEKGLHLAGLGRISAANAQYLETAFNDAFTGFLVLSGIKSGLAIIEGSEIGLGFNLEVGDIVQSVYDYVDIAWKTLLAGTTILMATRLIVKGAAHLDHWVLLVMLLVLFFHLTVRWWFPGHRKTMLLLKEALLFFLVGAVSLYVLLPISIAGASGLSNLITAPLVSSSKEGFARIHEEISPEFIRENFFPKDDADEASVFSRFDFKAKYENTRKRIGRIGDYLKTETREMALLTIQLITGYVFDCIIFPLTLFMALFIFTRAMVRYALGMQRNAEVSRQVTAMLDRKEFTKHKWECYE